MRRLKVLTSFICRGTECGLMLFRISQCQRCQVFYEINLSHSTWISSIRSMASVLHWEYDRLHISSFDSLANPCRHFTNTPEAVWLGIGYFRCKTLFFDCPPEHFRSSLLVHRPSQGVRRRRSRRRTRSHALMEGTRSPGLSPPSDRRLLNADQPRTSQVADKPVLLTISQKGRFFFSLDGGDVEAIEEKQFFNVFRPHKHPTDPWWWPPWPRRSRCNVQNGRRLMTALCASRFLIMHHGFDKLSSRCHPRYSLRGREWLHHRGEVTRPLRNGGLPLRWQRKASRCLAFCFP